MPLERKVSGIEQVHARIVVVTAKRFGTKRQEERVAFFPDHQKRWALLTDRGLEFRVQRDVACVILERIELDVLVAGPR